MVQERNSPWLASFPLRKQMGHEKLSIEKSAAEHSNGSFWHLFHDQIVLRRKRCRGDILTVPLKVTEQCILEYLCFYAATLDYMCNHICYSVRPDFLFNRVKSILRFHLTKYHCDIYHWPYHKLCPSQCNENTYFTSVSIACHFLWCVCVCMCEKV